MDEMDLRNYALGFYGYGNLASNIWFVGPEEGGGGNRKEVENRIFAWQQNRHEIYDGPDFIGGKLGGDWFRKDAPLQGTWRRLIITACAAGYVPAVPASAEIPPENVLQEVQRTWGATSGPTLLTELQPFPSPDAHAWNYRDWFPDVPFLKKTRSPCLREFSGHRICRIRKFIATEIPQHVVLYGKSTYWSRIAGQEIPAYQHLEHVWHVVIHNVHYWNCLHPKNRDIKKKTECDQYFFNLGTHIRNPRR